MKCAKLTKNKTVEEIVDLEKFPRSHVNLEKYPIPPKLIVPEWGGTKVGLVELMYAKGINDINDTFLAYILLGQKGKINVNTRNNITTNNCQ